MSHQLTERNEEIERLVVSGLSLQQVGERYGISRQRVAQIVGSTSLVPARPVWEAVKGRDLKALAAEYAQRFEVTFATARSKLSELQWRPTLRYDTADRILLLIGQRVEDVMPTAIRGS